MSEKKDSLPVWCIILAFVAFLVILGLASTYIWAFIPAVGFVIFLLIKMNKD